MRRLVRSLLFLTVLATGLPLSAQTVVGPCRMDGTDCAAGGAVDDPLTLGTLNLGTLNLTDLLTSDATTPWIAAPQTITTSTAPTGRLVLCTDGQPQMTPTAGQAGRLVTIVRIGGSSCTIESGGGIAIDDTAEFASITLAAGEARTFVQVSDTAWRTVTDYPAAHGVTTNAVPYASSSTAFGSLSLVRESADITAFRNGTTAQELRVHATYGGGGTDYERLYARFTSNVWRIGTEKGGSGAARDLAFYYDGSLRLTVNNGGLTTSNVYPSASDGLLLGSTAAYWQYLFVSRGIVGSKSKALTESTDTGFLRMDISTGSSRGIKVTYTVRAADATDWQSITGEVWVDGSNKAGVISLGTIGHTQAAACACTTGTLTATPTIVDAGSGRLEIRMNAVSSLTQTTLAIDYTPILPVSTILTNL